MLRDESFGLFFSESVTVLGLCLRACRPCVRSRRALFIRGVWLCLPDRSDRGLTDIDTWPPITWS
jgi:hypothetical protein